MAKADAKWTRIVDHCSWESRNLGPDIEQSLQPEKSFLQSTKMPRSLQLQMWSIESRRHPVASYFSHLFDEFNFRLAGKGRKRHEYAWVYHAHGAKSGPVPCPKCTLCMPGHIDHEENEEGDPAQCTKRLLRQRPKRCKCSVAVASVLHTACCPVKVRGSMKPCTSSQRFLDIFMTFPSWHH